MTARNAFPKQRITPDTELYTITDLSRVWIMADVFEAARWVRDLRRFLPLKSQFVLSGNILDLQAHDVGMGAIAAVLLQNVLASELAAAPRSSRRRTAP